MYGYILELQVKWVGDKLEETWEPECNVPKTMVDAFERGEQGPSTYLHKVEKKFGITMVTNLKVKATNETSGKRRKIDDIYGQQKGYLN